MCSGTAPLRPMKPFPPAHNLFQTDNSSGKCGGISSNSIGQKSLEKPPLRANILGLPFESVGTHYALGPVLGEGVTSHVRQCIDKRTCVSMACKTMPKSGLQNRMAIKDLRAEVAALKTLADHHGIVRLQKSFEDEENVHLIMDICEGGDLFDRIKQRKRYSERNAAYVCRTIASVLSYSHSKGIVHRDIKPENIFLVSKNSDIDVKVGDFGLSTFFRAGSQLKRIGGSPFYIAPEVLDQSYGPAIDNWSLGVCLYIMLSGVPPFRGDTQEKILDNIRKGEVNMETGPWKETSEEAKDLVRQLLCLDPELRITAGQVKGHPWIKQHCSHPAASPNFQPPIATVLQSSSPTSPSSHIPNHQQHASPVTRLRSPNGTAQLACASHGTSPLSQPPVIQPHATISTSHGSLKIDSLPLSTVLKRANSRRRSSEFSPVCVPSVSITRRHSIEIPDGDGLREGSYVRRVVGVRDYISMSPSSSGRDAEEEPGRLLRMLSTDSESGSMGSTADVEHMWVVEDMELGEETKLEGERRSKACGKSDNCHKVNGVKDLYSDSTFVLLINRIGSSS